MMGDRRYPLHYPLGWDRTKYRKRSAFNRDGSRTFAQARDALLSELRLLGARQVVLSTNVPLRQDGLPYARFNQPVDPGAAVYFVLDKKDMALACDRWDRVVDNIWAIAKHIKALRGQKLWGVGTLAQAFRGYEALLPPPGATAGQQVEPQWWEVLGVAPTASREVVEAAYRTLAKSRHPDTGGSEQEFIQLNQALEQGRATWEAQR